MDSNTPIVSPKPTRAMLVEYLQTFNLAILDITQKMDQEQDTLSSEELTSAQYIAGLCSVYILSLENILNTNLLSDPQSNPEMEDFLAVVFVLSQELQQNGLGRL